VDLLTPERRRAMAEEKKKAKQVKSGPKLKTEIIEVLRARLKKMSTRCRSAETSLREHENKWFKETRKWSAMEEASTTLFDVVRILADQVPNTTSAGRDARAEARKLLEAQKIMPPATLGKSRVKRVRKKRKTKKRLTGPSRTSS